MNKSNTTSTGRDYIVTFSYGDERNKVRVNNSPSERDAIVSAKVKARLLGIPVEESSISIKEAAYTKIK